MINLGKGLATGEVVLPVFIAVLLPLPLLFIDDPFLYWAGRRYGSRFKNYFIQQDPAWQGRLDRGERIMARWSFWAIIACNIPFVPIPVSVIYFLAGDTKMSMKKFVIANFIGLEIFICGTIGLGYVLKDQAQSVSDTVSNTADG